MRKFNVKVNGNTYNVEIEETDGSTVQSAPVSQVTAAAAPVSAPMPKAEGGTIVKAPMPGLILSLSVPNGATVKKNQKILVLEAMKMENDILASSDGVVTFIAKQGDSVETGNPLASIK